MVGIMYEKVMDWLLEKDNPMVRYNTLIHLMDRSHTDPEVEEAASQMIASPPIANIFKKQNDDGGFVTQKIVEKYGSEEARFGYVPKYKATTWQLSFLAQAGVPCDARIKALCEFIMRNTFNEELGVFGQIVQTRKGLQREVMPCLNGRMVWALSTYGFGHRKEVRKSFEFLTTYQRFDDGDFSGGDAWPYKDWSGNYCWGSASCFTGVSEFLRALTAVPETYMTPAAHEARDQAIDFMVRHRVLHRVLKQGSRGFPAKSTHRFGEMDWLLRLHAPLILCDAVEVITSLARLGVTDSALDEPINRILAKRNETDRWILEYTPPSMYGRWGKKGKENKWITFRILRMLKEIHRSHT
jgi:hypothetical protein